MNKDLRRKQKKAKRAIRAAKRRVNMATKSQAPRFDPGLPTSEAGIEAEMEKLLPQLTHELPSSVEHDEHGRTITLSPTMRQIMRLQLQLFRVVFGREPGPNDPVFWDRDRETEGVFNVDVEQERQGLSRALAKTDIRPDVAYAIALTGVIPLEGRRHLDEEEDLERWQAAVDDYVHQAATGVPPLAPDELIYALTTAKGVFEHPNVIPIGIAGYPKTDMNKILATLEAELGTYEKAAAAMTRIAALVEIAEHEEFQSLLSPAGYSEAALVAAESAEIDRGTGKFVQESFRERLE